MFSSSKSGIKVLCFTWNVGNSAPKMKEHETWLPANGGDFDLIVVGTQENGGWEGSGSTTTLNTVAPEAAEVSFSKASATAGVDVVIGGTSESRVHIGAWEAMVLKRLGPAWDVAQHTRLLHMALTVYARKSAMGAGGQIKAIQHGRSATGIAGQVGNKGGLVVGLQYGTTHLGFVSAHLAAHMGRVADRNSDYHEVLRETRARVGTSRLTDASNSFDHLIWMGDLNYRIDVGYLLARNATPVAVQRSQSSLFIGASESHDSSEDANVALLLVQSKAWDKLMLADQLRVSQEEGTSFTGFREGKIAFAPTFKVETRTGLLYNPKRVPSYCDRILWKSMPSMSSLLTQTLHLSVPSVSSSDHKPVLAHFVIEPTPSLSTSQQLDTSALLQQPTVKRTFTLGSEGNAQKPAYPLVRLSKVRVFLKGSRIDAFSSTCDPYAVLLTHPPGLLGLDPPCTPVIKSPKCVPAAALIERIEDEHAKRYMERRVTTFKLSEGEMHGYTWAWSDRQMPVLRPRVLGGEAELAQVNLILTMFDRDVVNNDDMLGTATIPLGLPASGYRGTREGYEWDVRVPVPWEHGIGFLQCTVSVAHGGQLAEALLKASKEKAGSASSLLSRQGNDCAGKRACEVQ